MSDTVQKSKPRNGPQAKKCQEKKSRDKKRDSFAHRAQLSPAYHKHDFKEKLSAAIKDNENFQHDNKARLYSDPFTCCVLPKFIKDEQFLEGLKDELLDQIFYEKTNDLYKFHQSDDLRKVSSPHVKALRKLLYEDFLDWLKDVTGFPLTDKVDMTCSRYDYTDTLLCHDDELEDRRIAFILYLVPQWKESDGGTLDLFNMDEHGQPKDIVHSVVPEWNKFAWFEVTQASHHQVSEVLTEDKTRLSVNGWFHGPPVPRPGRYTEPCRPLMGYIEIEEEMFNDWINPVYLDPEVQGQIQEKFENDSEIELLGFLKENKYQEVVSALKSTEMKWNQRGPPNKRNYCEADKDSLPEIMQECIKFLQSEALFLTLSNLTGLTLHPLAAHNNSDESESEDQTAASEGQHSSDTSDKNKPENKRRRIDSKAKQEKEEKSKNTEYEGNPRCRCEVRRWTHGSYTLVHDTDPEGSEFALDAMLFCSCKGWQQEYGGYTSYIAKGEDEELLTVNPAENSLALVYRDKDTLRFVKHINNHVNDIQNNNKEFYDFSLVYFE